MSSIRRAEAALLHARNALNAALQAHADIEAAQDVGAPEVPLEASQFRRGDRLRSAATALLAADEHVWNALQVTGSALSGATDYPVIRSILEAIGEADMPAADDEIETEAENP